MDTRSFHRHDIAYYVVMEDSTIFTEIGDVDTRSFHRHGIAYYVVMEHSTIFTKICDVDTRSFHLLCGDGDFHIIYWNRLCGREVLPLIMG